VTTSDVATIAVADGAMLVVPRSDEAVEESAHTFDPGRLPGVVVSASRAWREHGREVIVGCARAPGSSFFDGAEQLVFERANQIARTSIGRVIELEPHAIDHRGPRWLQRFYGDDGLRFTGRHTLSFTASGREAVLCTTVCRGDAAACDAIIDATKLEGDLGPPPPPSAWITAAFAAANHPRAAAISAAMIVVAIVAFLLWRRPRPSSWPRA
jgi:hypothetical protein